ncbi:type II toxin-antitoxin system mRNA interferase toxin, RelE/StbE family [Campylobacter fetus]|nr:type II toxin-antitoxin system mRNA interferase toxin, RelE/StbE family [Campylobacter fetus]
MRDCHIKPDLVLLYKVINNELALIALRVNSHSEVFK